MEGSDMVTNNNSDSEENASFHSEASDHSMAQSSKSTRKLSSTDSPQSPEGQSNSEENNPPEQKSLQAQMTDMAKLLESINTTLNTHTISFEKLESDTEELKEDFTKLSASLANDLVSAKESYDRELTDLEEKLTKKQVNTLDEVTKSLDAHKIKMAEEVHSLKSVANSESEEIHNIKTTVDHQKSLITSLESSLAVNTAHIDELKKHLQKHIKKTKDKFYDIQECVDEVRIMVNDVEAHERRWSLRIIGLPAPEGIENTDQAKDVMIKFLIEKLNILNIVPDDIDCCH
jgi:chromosome segregation ATPase